MADLKGCLGQLLMDIYLLARRRNCSYLILKAYVLCCHGIVCCSIVNIQPYRLANLELSPTNKQLIFILFSRHAQVIDYYPGFASRSMKAILWQSSSIEPDVLMDVKLIHSKPACDVLY